MTCQYYGGCIAAYEVSDDGSSCITSLHYPVRSPIKRQGKNADTRAAAEMNEDIATSFYVDM